MFNLIVQSGGWERYEDTFLRSRIFEYTDDHIIEEHKVNGFPNFEKLKKYPALLMPEMNRGDNLARVATINGISAGQTDVRIKYTLDPYIPPVSVDWIYDIAPSLQMNSFEFHRTHWALKDVDLFRVFIGAIQPQQNSATVFKIRDKSAIQSNQLSAMMPFDKRFSDVYTAIQQAGVKNKMTVSRADDIWENHHIIQDIVSLIDRSRIVVADCTDKNANVFYEVGIAHAIGREVILITQSMDHIPFDLRHLRCLTYHPNNEGLAALEAGLTSRIATLLSA